ncbi:hypothetical protein ACFL6L_00790 [candidate division KSB1 bacterium]
MRKIFAVLLVFIISVQIHAQEVTRMIALSPGLNIEHSGDLGEKSLCVSGNFSIPFSSTLALRLGAGYHVFRNNASGDMEILSLMPGVYIKLPFFKPKFETYLTAGGGLLQFSKNNHIRNIWVLDTNTGLFNLESTPLPGYKKTKIGAEAGGGIRYYYSVSSGLFLEYRYITGFTENEMTAFSAIQAGILIRLRRY